MVKALKSQDGGYLRTGSNVDLWTFNPERKRTFLVLIAKFWPDVSRCCREVGIHNTTFYNHMKQDAKFCEEIKAIKAAKLDEIEAVAMKSARSQKRGFLDRAMMLRAHRPETFDRAKVVKIEGYKMAAGEVRERLGAVEGAIDAEVVKTYQDRKQRREAKRQQQLKAGEGTGGGGAQGK